MFWAKPFWRFIHILTFVIWKFYGANIVYQQNVRDFLLQLPHLVPCPQCVRHCAEYIESNPPPEPSDDIKLSDRFIRWSVTFHNSVSLRIGKKPYDVDHVLHQYEKGNFDIVDVDTNDQWEANMWTVVSVAVFIILVGVVSYILIDKFAKK